MSLKHFKLSPLQSGTGWIATATLFWASGGLFEKYLLLSINPVTLAFSVACCAMLSLLAFNHFAFRILYNQFRKCPWLYVGLGLTGFALPYPLFYQSLQHLPLGIAACLIKLSPVFVILFSYAFMRERLNWIQITAAFAAIICAVLATTPIPQIIDFEIENIGAFLLAIAAAICFAAATLFSKAILNHHISPLHATTIRFVIGTLLLMPYLILSGNHQSISQIAPHSWFGVIILGVVFEAIAMIIYYRGMRHVSTSFATLCELLQTLFSVFLGFVFLQEVLSWPQYLAITGLIAAIGVIAFQENRVAKIAEKSATSI